MCIPYKGTDRHADPLSNVRSVKKDTKRSSNTVLRLVSFFTERTLEGKNWTLGEVGWSKMTPERLNNLAP